MVLVQDLGAPPDHPSPGPKFRFFSLARHNFHSFFSLLKFLSKFHERTPKRVRNKEKCGGRGKKARNFGPPTLLCPTVRGPTLRRHVGIKKRHLPKQVYITSGPNRSGLNARHSPQLLQRVVNCFHPKRVAKRTQERAQVLVHRGCRRWDVLTPTPIWMGVCATRELPRSCTTIRHIVQHTLGYHEDRAPRIPS